MEGSAGLEEEEEVEWRAFLFDSLFSPPVYITVVGGGERGKATR